MFNLKLNPEKHKMPIVEDVEEDVERILNKAYPDKHPKILNRHL